VLKDRSVWHSEPVAAGEESLCEATKAEERFLVAALLGMTAIRPRSAAAGKLAISTKTLPTKRRGLGLA